MNESSVVRAFGSTESDAGEPSINIDPKEVRSLLAEGDEFIGDVKAACGIRVAGKITGNLESRSGVIVIEKTGVVTGSVRGSDRVYVDGRVGEEGQAVQIHSPGTVTLMGNCIVNADIEYGRLATLGDMTHNGSSRKIKAA
jgi:cytoskeletal protein CcmA (bactofilin family)